MQGAAPHAQVLQWPAYQALGDDAWACLRAASQDCTARVWDMEIGDCVLVMDGHSGPVTSIALAGNTLVTGSQDKSARVWDMQRGSCQRLLRAHLGTVNDVAITPDAQTIVTASSDGTARVWRLSSGDCRHVLSTGNSGAGRWNGMTGRWTGMTGKEAGKWGGSQGAGTACMAHGYPSSHRALLLASRGAVEGRVQ